MRDDPASVESAIVYLSICTTGESVMVGCVCEDFGRKKTSSPQLPGSSLANKSYIVLLFSCVPPGTKSCRVLVWTTQRENVHFFRQRLARDPQKSTRGMTKLKTYQHLTCDSFHDNESQAPASVCRFGSCRLLDWLPACKPANQRTDTCNGHDPIVVVEYLCTFLTLWSRCYVTVKEGVRDERKT